MRAALSSPHPYLLNGAGGICGIKQFSLVSGELKIVPEAEKPLEGEYHLIYRCPDHDLDDIKLAVFSDGSKWSIVGPMAQEDDCDVCYPEPCKTEVASA